MKEHEHPYWTEHPYKHMDESDWRLAKDKAHQSGVNLHHSKKGYVVSEGRENKVTHKRLGRAVQDAETRGNM